jgi:hypothetical protein
MRTSIKFSAFHWGCAKGRHPEQAREPWFPIKHDAIPMPLPGVTGHKGFALQFQN